MLLRYFCFGGIHKVIQWSPQCLRAKSNGRQLVCLVALDRRDPKRAGGQLQRQSTFEGHFGNSPPCFKTLRAVSFSQMESDVSSLLGLKNWGWRTSTKAIAGAQFSLRGRRLEVQAVRQTSHMRRVMRCMFQCLFERLTPSSASARVFRRRRDSLFVSSNATASQRACKTGKNFFGKSCPPLIGQFGQQHNGVSPFGVSLDVYKRTMIKLCERQSVAIVVRQQSFYCKSRRR